MEYRFLGASGAKVSAVGLGTMNFNKSNIKEGIAVLERYAELGGNFIDTADVYSAGESEIVVGEWLATVKRDDFFIATKVFFQGGRTDPNRAGLGRRHILTTVKEQLARLQTDFIDLLQIHNWDEQTPVREWVTTLNELITNGRIRHYGLCNVTGWQLQKVLSTCEALGLRGPISVQNQYSLLSRQVEWEVLHCCAANGIAFLPWSPLKGGWLTGKFRKDADPDPESRVGQVTAGKRRALQSSPTYKQFANDKTWALLAAMDEIAEAKKATVAQVALRWLLQRPMVQSVLMGPRTLTQMEDCIGAMKFELAKEEMQTLGDASALEIPYPYEMVWRACRPGDRLDGNLWPLPGAPAPVTKL